MKRKNYKGLFNLLVVLGGLSIIFETNTVIASPSNSIQLDENTSNEFSVPKDSTSLIEDVLKNNPAFNGYVQNGKILTTFEKKNIQSYSSNQKDEIGGNPVFTRNGGVIFPILSRNDNDVLSYGLPKINQEAIIYVDKDGNIKEEGNVAQSLRSDPNKTLPGNVAPRILIGGSSPIFSVNSDYGNGSGYYQYFNYYWNRGDMNYANSYKFFDQGGNIVLDENSNSRKLSMKNITNLSFPVSNLQSLESTQYLIGNPSTIVKYGYTMKSGSYSSIELPIFKKGVNESDSAFKSMFGSSVSSSEFMNKIYNYYNQSNVAVNRNRIWGIWLYDVGENTTSKNPLSKYYGRIVVRGINNESWDEYLVRFKSSSSNWIDTEDFVSLAHTNSSGSSIGGFNQSKILQSISTGNEIFIKKTGKDKVVLTKVPIDGNNNFGPEKTLLTLPGGSFFEVVKDANENNNGYIIFGQLGKEDAMFNQYNVHKGEAFLGTLNENFELKSIEKVFSAPGTLNISNIVKNGENLFIAGNGTTRTFGNPPKDGWKENSRYSSEANINAIFGFLKQEKDYAPVIQSNQNGLTLDKDSMTTNQMEKKILDGISVYDVADFSASSISGQKNMDWLRTRINRNPKKISYNQDGVTPTSLPNIDWEKLGLDFQHVGPQGVTNFISDSKNNTTATSMLVNIVDSNVSLKDDYAMRVKNFDVDVENIINVFSKEEDLKNLSELLIWNTKTGEVSDNNINVEISEADIKNIMSVKSKYDEIRKKAVEDGKDPDFEVDYTDILKPYPVTYTYTYNFNGLSKHISKIATVFITDKTTKVQKDIERKGAVIYANNFIYPLQLAKDATNEIVKNKSHLRIYDYAHVWTDGMSEATKMPTDLVNTNINDPFVSGVHNDLTGLKNVDAEGDYVMKYNWKDSKGNVFINDLTKVRVDNIGVNLKLHLRQIVENPNNAIVIPKKGYTRIQSRDNNNNLTGKNYNFVINSGDDKNTPYTNCEFVTYEKGYFTLDSNEFVPQYYTQNGFTYGESATSQSGKFGGKLPLYYSDPNKEYWVTLYIKPTSNKPIFYSWAYIDSFPNKVIK